jgi:eukaryotic-like serine/threonine-protein kinase
VPVPFTALGGVIQVACDGSTARVVGLNPTAGYAVKDYEPGPADEVKVVLRSATNESELRVKCEGGQPIPNLKESPR